MVTTGMDYNELELQFLRQVFRQFDTNETGHLQVDEFVKLIDALAKAKAFPERSAAPSGSLDDSVIKAVFAYYDVNADGKLSFQEIYTWWTSPDRFRFFTGDQARLLKKAHQLFETYSVLNGGKCMTFSEFESLLSDKMIEHDESVFDHLDKDGDGLMSFREFAGWLNWF